MKAQKTPRASARIRVLVSLLCVAAMLLSLLPATVFSAVAAEGGNRVTAETSGTVEQGSTGYCYVYIDSLAGLSSLDVEVYFDSAKVTVLGTYNVTAASLYDYSEGEASVRYSYIFDGNGSDGKTLLFYIYYQVKETAAIGDTYFDITVTDAYDATLNPVAVSGSRCDFTVTEPIVQKYAYVYGTDSVYTSVGEEFELTYYMSTDQIAAGSMVLHYDPELFELVSLTQLPFLTEKITDINTATSGSIHISFLSTEYGEWNHELMSVRFRAVKNQAVASDIQLAVTAFHDLDLSTMIAHGCTTRATIEHDPTYTEDAPAITLVPIFDASSGRVTATVRLDKDSHLGAGDFKIVFDPSLLTYVSAEKGFTPTFFNINDKNAASGEIKFSIISMEDITDEVTVLTLTFDATRGTEDVTTEFTFEGSGLSDAMTNGIMLNFVASPLQIPAETPDPSAGVIEHKSYSVSFDDIMYINKYFTISGLDESVYGKAYIEANGGMLVWSSEISEDEAVIGHADAINKEGLVQNIRNGVVRYTQQTNGIVPKKYGDTVYMRVYLRLEDGTYLYGSLDTYSIKNYCMTIWGRESSSEVAKSAMAATLNYGAAAQVYFNYRTDALANEGITSSAFDASMLTPLASFTTDLAATETFKISKSVSFDEALRINFYYTVSTFEWTVATAELQIWDGVSDLTEANITLTTAMKQAGARWTAQSPEMTVRDYEDTIYVRAKFTDTDGHVHYSDIVAYSIEQYAADILAKSTNENMKQLVRSAVVYGEATRAYLDSLRK